MARRDQLGLFFSPYIKGPLFLPCPLVTTIHDLMFLVHPDYTHWSTAPRRWLFTRIARLVARRATAILTDSEFSRHDIERLLRVPTQKLTVVPIGVPSSYRPECEASIGSQIARRYGLTRPYVLYVGNFKPHKNLALLLRAFARLPEYLRQRYQLVLAGGLDRFQPPLAALAAELGIAQRLVFPGFIAEDDMPALYSAAELFVFPSLYEGFGLPVLEAMACGAPVVCTRAACLPEVAGEAAILIDPHSVTDMAGAIERCLTDDDLRQGLRARGRQRVQEFAPHKTAGCILSVLEQVLQPANTP